MPADDPMNTPAMRQFQEIKKNYPDSILFFRMGDFYEMFGEDAIIASSILDIALTKRQNLIPMCGIPYHAKDNYLSRLINAGKRVVICEQSKSNQENSKLLQRDVVRVISPGTIVEENLIGGFENNFLALFHFHRDMLGVAFLDISTSDFYFSKFHKSEKIEIQSILNKFNPTEVLLFKENAISYDNLEIESTATITLLDSNQISLPVGVESEILKNILNSFMRDTIKDSSINLSEPKTLSKDEFLELDSNTIKNLELVDNQNINVKNHTLFSVLNKCTTGNGKRYLKKRILFPYRDITKILDTRNKIQILQREVSLHKTIIQYLGEIPDIERIINRFKISGKALPRDFRSIQRAIEISILLKNKIQDSDYPFNPPNEILDKLYQYINIRLHDGELPAILGGEGVFIRNGFSVDLDEARKAKSLGKDWIVEFESREKRKFGISTLKVRFNKVVGYFIEVSRKDAESIPATYFKKQTLVTSERFTSDELQEIERKILGADELIISIEENEYKNLIQKSLDFYHPLLELSHLISELDFHSSLALCMTDYKWKLPEINSQNELTLENSRHPVVETYLPPGGNFISNSIQLDSQLKAIAILTGPNMAGKSTFMRQIAICQILFQMGSAIPAEKANLSICDRVFTRIGSGDNLTAGESTFYVEMKESAHILNHRTENSLILFDEIGRGTSTYDGLSLAWGIVEHLSRPLSDGKRTKTIFATHYHELTELEKENGVFNLYMDTKETNGEVIFLKKVRNGKAKKSFGIYVARLAGIPAAIVDRSVDILQGLESKKKEIKYHKEEEPDLFTISKNSKFDKWEELIKTIDPDSLSPKEALEWIYKLKEFFKK